MKLISSTPSTPHKSPKRPDGGWFLRRLRSRLFSVRNAWWTLVVIVAAFAISVFLLLRWMLETSLRDI